MLDGQSSTASAGIRVADTQEALQALALAQRRQFPGTVVAITGSNGKTTKEMTAAVLQQRYATCKALGISITTLVCRWPCYSWRPPTRWRC